MGDSTPAYERFINYHWRLPCCGCVMTQTVRHTGSISVDAEAAAKFGEQAHTRLAHWFAVRSARHRCELVSEDNPYGLLPKDT